jgi:hypothetical protein
MRRVIHKRDKGVVRRIRVPQDFRLSPTGVEVSRVLNRKAVRHSGVQTKASIPTINVTKVYRYRLIAPRPWLIATQATKRD